MRLSSVSVLSQRMITQYVHAVVVINLQKIADLLRARACSAFSLAFDAGANHEHAYISICIRTRVTGKVTNICCLVIPFNESHTAHAIFQVIAHTLKALMGDMGA